MYEGSCNYDFDNYDPNDPYAPALPDDSDRVGHFGYGGSSIVLAFEPNVDLQFGVLDVLDKGAHTKPVSDPDHPTLMQIEQCLGKRMPTLKWPA